MDAKDDKESNDCTVFYFKAGIIGDLIRAVLISSILFKYSNVQSTEKVPSNYMQNFEDFFNDLECTYYFKKFLSSKHPEAIIDLEMIFADLVTDPNQSRQSIFSPKLIMCFNKYKLTKSFITLFNLRVHNEKVMSKGYVSFR